MLCYVNYLKKEKKKKRMQEFEINIMCCNLKTTAAKKNGSYNSRIKIYNNSKSELFQIIDFTKITRII